MVVGNFAEILSGKIGRTKLIEYKIRVTQPQPIALNPYPYPHAKQQMIDDMLQDMKRQGLIEPSTSSWVAPIVLVRKKDGSQRGACKFLARWI